MIQIKKNGQVLSSNFEQLRSEFARQSCVPLPQLIEPLLLEHLRRQVAAARLVTKIEGDDHDQFGKVLFVPQTEPALFVFHLLMNNRHLFQAIEAITQCRPIGNFVGRLHSSVPGGQHHIAWHGDNADHRLIGLTVDLSGADYEGGVFQLRRKDAEEIICEMPRRQTGDAFIFRISPDLQHRLTVLERGGPRTAGVGWFRSQPSFSAFAKRYFQFLPV
jgi:hypothetical protein